MLSEEFETKMDLDSIEAISKPKIGSDSNGNRLKKCVRKGDIICFSKSENINMLPTNGNVSNLNKKVSLNATNNCSERILSGESLYKTFTFEQSSIDDDTEKCISFWKSVMEKNLAPIKCSLIESIKKRQAPEHDHDAADKTVIDHNSTDEEREIVRNNNNEEINKIHEEYRNLFATVFKEVQKKKLNQLKLTAERRCKFCDSIAAPPPIDSCDIDKSTLCKEIKNLNHWKSNSKKQRFDNLNADIKESSSDESLESSGNTGDTSMKKVLSLNSNVKTKQEKANIKPSMKFVNSNLGSVKTRNGVQHTSIENKSRETECKNIVSCNTLKPSEDISSNIINKHSSVSEANNNITVKGYSKAVKKISNTVNTRSSSLKQRSVMESEEAIEKAEFPAKNDEKLEPKKPKPPPDTNIYEFVNIKEEKKKTGKYREWRSNKVKQRCTCETLNCDCNINPAITVIKSQTGSPNEIKKKNNNGSSSEICLQQVRSILLTGNNNERRRSNARKSLTLIYKNCTCNEEDCDCMTKEVLSKEQLNDDTTEDYAKPPTVAAGKPRRDSLELLKVRLSRSNLTETSDNLTNTYRYIDKKDNHISHTDETKIIYKSPSEDSISRILSAQEIQGIQQEKPNHKKIKRAVSLALKNCPCLEDSCDCFVKELINRPPLKATDRTSLPAVPSQLRRVRSPLGQIDSVELIREKLSKMDIQSDKQENKCSSSEEVHSTIAIDGGRA